MTFQQEMVFRDCPWCGVRDAQFRFHGNMAAQSMPKGVTREYAWLSCPRCAGVVVLEVSPGPTDHRVLATIPTPGADSAVEHLPPDVERYYRDARKVLDAGVPDAAAVQLRRTLEAAAAHRGVTSGALVTRIKELIKQGHITVEFGQVLDLIRKTGNVGAHAGEEDVDEDEAKRALRFTTQVLRNLFEIPAELGVAPAGDQVDAADG